jgi:hypothetical protein
MFRYSSTMSPKLLRRRREEAFPERTHSEDDDIDQMKKLQDDCVDNAHSEIGALDEEIKECGLRAIYVDVEALGLFYLRHRDDDSHDTTIIILHAFCHLPPLDFSLLSL